MDSQFLKESLDAVLETLSEREAGVIAFRFGLVDGQSYSLEDIGNIYGVTRERIRQIEKKALQKLRHPARSEFLRSFLDYEVPCWEQSFWKVRDVTKVLEELEPDDYETEVVSSDLYCGGW